MLALLLRMVTSTILAAPACTLADHTCQRQHVDTKTAAPLLARLLGMVTSMMLAAPAIVSSYKS